MSRAWAFLTYALDRQASGIGQYSIRLLDSYRKLGLEPFVLQSGRWPPGFDPTGFKTINLPGASLLPALLTLGQIQLGWHSWHQDLALVHDVTGIMPLSLCNVNKVVTIHDAIPYVAPMVSTALDRLIYHFWLPNAVKAAHAVITISQYSKSDLQNYLSIPDSKITVIPLAAGAQFRRMSPNEFQPALDRAGVEKPYILCVGSIEPRKNIIRILDAYKQLLAWSPRWNLVIVGAHNYWKSSPVAAQVERLGLQARVKLTGYVPDQDLPALYSAADLFCFPSLYEGFGLPILEAMACGTPVITSNITSMPEVAGGAALLVDPNVTEQITTAMRTILEFPDVAYDLGERGLFRAAQFTWEQTATDTIAVYKKVLS